MKNRYINIRFNIKGNLRKHIFGNRNIGNCALCGEFLDKEGHHTIKRSRGGTDDDLVDVCHKCHVWIETHPKEATELKLNKRGYKINK